MKFDNLDCSVIEDDADHFLHKARGGYALSKGNVFIIDNVDCPHNQVIDAAGHRHDISDVSRINREVRLFNYNGVAVASALVPDRQHRTVLCNRNFVVKGLCGTALNLSKQIMEAYLERNHVSFEQALACDSSLAFADNWAIAKVEDKDKVLSVLCFNTTPVALVNSKKAKTVSIKNDLFEDEVVSYFAHNHPEYRIE